MEIIRNKDINPLAHSIITTIATVDTQVKEPTKPQF